MTDLEDYIRRARPERYLTADAEQRLGTMVQAGQRAAQRIERGEGTPDDQAAVTEGTKARWGLVEANLRLVVSIARKFPTHTVLDLGDLIQAGNDGLIMAADRFDPALGFRFSTYASKWIRSRIGRAIDKHTSALGIPIDDVNSLRRAMRDADGQATHLPARLVELERAYSAVSLDGPLVEGGDLYRDVQASDDDSIEMQVGRRLRESEVRRALAELPLEHRQALGMRFGFVDGDPRSKGVVASTLGVSARRSGRLIDEGLLMVRSRLQAEP